MLEDPKLTVRQPRDNAIFGLLLVIFVAGSVIFEYFYGRTFSDNPYVIAATLLFPLFIAFLNLIPALTLDKHRVLMLTLFHISGALLLIFVVPILSPYLMVCIILAYLCEYYYQARGVAISLSALGLTIGIGVWNQYQPISQEIIIQAVEWYLLLLAIILMLSQVMLGNRKQRRELSQKVLRSEYEHERMVNLINSMTEAVLSVDDKGVINIFNAAALDLLDTNVEIGGKNICDLLKLYDASEQPVDPLNLAAETRYLSHRNDLYLQFSADEKISLDISISRTTLSLALDQKAGYTFILRDITEQKSLDEQKDIFISQVSHELRTPITVAEANVSMAQLLLERPDTKPSDMKEALEKAHRQVLFLAEMVNDLSTLSRAERTDKPMEIETFDIYELLSNIYNQYQPQATQKKLELKILAERGLPKLTTSKLYLSEILQNFITNAIKYTPSGRVTVQAKRNEQGAIMFFVADTGIGIAKTEQDKVFDKFWRSEDPLTRQTNGTGLGLYITMQLAHRMGATLDVESELKKGTVFTITLPAVSTQPSDQAQVVEHEFANLLDI